METYSDTYPDHLTIIQDGGDNDSEKSELATEELQQRINDLFKKQQQGGAGKKSGSKKRSGSKKKGSKKDAIDPSVPLLKPTSTSKPGSSKPTTSTWKEWEVRSARDPRDRSPVRCATPLER